MDLGVIVQFLLEHGVMPVVTGIFMYTFLKRDKEREKYLAKRDDEFTQTLKECNDSSERSFEKLLGIVMEESAKRETMISRQIDKQGETIKEVSTTLGNINNAMVETNFRLSNLERERRPK